jgi:hypothetical protein
MMTGLLAGAFIGGKVIIWQKSKNTDNSKSDNKAEAPARDDSGSLLPKFGIFMIIVLIAIALSYYQNSRNILAGVILFSAAFGLVFQRSGLGFATAFREVFTTKNNETMRAVIISLIIGIIGFSIIKANGIKPANMFISPAGWHTVIGGLIFGFGMVMADG